MDDVKTQELTALTNLPIEITLGGEKYKARRLSLYDFALYEEYLEERKQSGKLVVLNLFGSAFLIGLAVNDFLEQKLSPEDILKKVKLGDEGTEELKQITEKLKGFKTPQIPVEEQKAQS